MHLNSDTGTGQQLSKLQVDNIPFYTTTAFLASLKPKRLLFLNPNQWNISNPYIMYVLCVHLYRSALAANLLLHRKYTSKSMELQTFRAQNKFQVLRTCLQNVRLHHTQPCQAKYSICISSKSLVSRMQNRSQIPTIISDRNIGHYLPAILLHRPQTSKLQFQNKPSVGRFF
jgi:hypothetical protein